jgi:hypothetical protein
MCDANVHHHHLTASLIVCAFVSSLGLPTPAKCTMRKVQDTLPLPQAQFSKAKNPVI